METREESQLFLRDSATLSKKPQLIRQSFSQARRSVRYRHAKRIAPGLASVPRLKSMLVLKRSCGGGREKHAESEANRPYLEARDIEATGRV